MNKKILVIGGSGFVGSLLLKNLTDCNVSNLDKRPSPFFNKITEIGNVLDKEKLKISLKNVETVVLLAAEHKDNVSPVSLYYDVNVNGTKNVLDAMDFNGVKNLIFTSSVAVYGLNKKCPNEFSDPDPFNHYGQSKFKAENLIKEWYNNNINDKSVTIVRPTVIFGERNRGNVFNLLAQIKSGRFLMIGKGKNKKSMAYVENVVAFIKDRLLTRKIGLEIYNYIDKPDFTMNELTLLVQKIVGVNIIGIKIPYIIGLVFGYAFDLLAFILKRKLPISSVRVKKFCATTQFDAKKVSKIFKPPFSLEKGLERTLNYEFKNTKNKDVLFYSE